MLTGLRFNQLKAGATPVDESEKKEYERHLLGEKRSKAAFKAVETKRKKYTTWPNRNNNHTLK